MKDITYSEWMLPMRQQQISVVALLTASLYVIFSVLETYYLFQPEDLPLIRFFHLYTMPPALIGISYLAYTKKYPNFLFITLMIAPIYANTGLYIILYNNPDLSVIYFAEVSLSIFWTFTISGLNLKQSIFTATVVVLITLFYLYIVNPYNMTDTIVSVFWVFASFSFGLIGAILLNGYTKKIYNNFIELQIISITDKLTGLYNRTFMDENFKMKLYDTQNDNITISIIMIDIDDFKEINDSYGHHIGDATLVQTAHIINNYADDNNIVIRWGGEEFLIISIDTNEQKTHKMCEEICKEIELYKFSIIEKSTISIGYSLSKDMDTFDLILNRADAALYMAKQNGKNRVESL